MFTGTKDTDRLILLELDDESFIALCSTSSYTHSLCDEALWASRFALKYGVTLWQYGVSHKDVYIDFSKLKENARLQAAIDNGFVNLVGKLIENASTIKLNYALTWASTARHINVEIVRLLISKGAKMRADIDKLLPDAVRSRNVKMVKQLLDDGADVHYVADYDLALSIAAESGYFGIVKLLIERGIDIHARNDEALRKASQRGNVEIVDLLKTCAPRGTSVGRLPRAD